MIYISGIIYFCPRIKTLRNLKKYVIEWFFLNKKNWYEDIHRKTSSNLMHVYQFISRDVLVSGWAVCLVQSSSTWTCSRVALPSKHQSPTRSMDWFLPLWNGLLWPFYACVPGKLLRLARNSLKDLTFKEIIVVASGIGKCLSYFPYNCYCVCSNWQAFGDGVYAWSS